MNVAVQRMNAMFHYLSGVQCYVTTMLSMFDLHQDVAFHHIIPKLKYERIFKFLTRLDSLYKVMADHDVF